MYIHNKTTNNNTTTSTNVVKFKMLGLCTSMLKSTTTMKDKRACKLGWMFISTLKAQRRACNILCV